MPALDGRAFNCIRAICIVYYTKRRSMIERLGAGNDLKYDEQRDGSFRSGATQKEKSDAYPTRSVLRKDLTRAGARAHSTQSPSRHNFSLSKKTARHDAGTLLL